MTDLWSTDRKCYVDRHGIDPSDDCSMLLFFSEVIHITNTAWPKMK